MECVYPTESAAIPAYAYVCICIAAKADEAKLDVRIQEGAWKSELRICDDAPSSNTLARPQQRSSGALSRMLCCLITPLHHRLVWGIPNVLWVVGCVSDELHSIGAGRFCFRLLTSRWRYVIIT